MGDKTSSPNVKLTGAALDRLKIQSRSALRRFMAGGSADRESLGFRVRFRLSDAYESVVKQEEEASTIKLHSPVNGILSGYRRPSRFKDSPDRVRPRPLSCVTRSVVDTTASTGVPSIPVSFLFPEIKTDKKQCTTDTASMLKTDGGGSSPNDNNVTNEKTKDKTVPVNRVKDGKQAGRPIKDVNETPPNKRQKKSDPPSSHAGGKKESKWKTMNLKKLGTVAEESNKMTKVKKALQAFGKNEKETKAKKLSNAASSKNEARAGSTASSRMEKGNGEDGSKAEEPDEEDGVPVAQYLYKLVNCREATNPEIILKSQPSDNQAVGIINLYDNHGKKKGEKSPNTPVCELCTEFRRKRVNTWLQSITETPVTDEEEMDENMENMATINHKHLQTNVMPTRGWSRDRVHVNGSTIITSRLDRPRLNEPIKRQDYNQRKPRNTRENLKESRTDRGSYETPCVHKRPIINGWTSEVIQSPTNTKISIRLCPIRGSSGAHRHSQSNVDLQNLKMFSFGQSQAVQSIVTRKMATSYKQRVY